MFLGLGGAWLPSWDAAVHPRRDVGTWGFSSHAAVAALETLINKVKLLLLNLESMKCKMCYKLGWEDGAEIC